MEIVESLTAIELHAPVYFRYQPYGCDHFVRALAGAFLSAQCEAHSPDTVLQRLLPAALLEIRKSYEELMVSNIDGIHIFNRYIHSLVSALDLQDIEEDCAHCSVPKE
jgi:hypothetical protein